MRRHDLVLLHGQPGTGEEWHDVIARLPPELRAVAPDRPGHGSSVRRGGGLDINAAAVMDEIDALGIERAVLVGHSYGGGVALRVAARSPERVEALVLLSSVGPDCLNFADLLLAAPLAGAACALVAWKLTPWLARAALQHMPRADRHPSWQVWGNTRWHNGPLWRTFLTEQKALMSEASLFGELAAAVRVPALVISDPRDPLVPFRTAVALTRALPDARLRLIHGAGHHLPLRAPAQVATEIVTFLEDAKVGVAAQPRPSDHVD